MDAIKLTRGEKFTLTLLLILVPFVNKQEESIVILNQLKLTLDI